MGLYFVENEAMVVGVLYYYLCFGSYRSYFDLVVIELGYRSNCFWYITLYFKIARYIWKMWWKYD